MREHRNFEQVYIHHWEKLYAFCFKMTRDDHLSQNIVQDIFTDLWERRADLKILAVENFLFRAAKYQVLKEYRKKSFNVTIADDLFENYQPEDVSGPDTEVLDKLSILLETLPEKRKEILVMNKLDQMDIDQIASMLNLSKQTVKNQISMALKQLKLHAREITALLIFFRLYP